MMTYSLPLLRGNIIVYHGLAELHLIGYGLLTHYHLILPLILYQHLISFLLQEDSQELAQQKIIVS